MTARTQLATMINIIPDNDLPIVLEVVRRFIPIDADVDDIETPEDTAAHMRAMEEFKDGASIAFEDVRWN